VARAIGPDVQVKSLAQLLHKRVGFGEEVAGVDEDDRDAGESAGGHVEEDGGFGAEGGGHDEVLAEGLGGPVDDARGVVGFERHVERVEIEGIEDGGHVLLLFSCREI